MKRAVGCKVCDKEYDAKVVSDGDVLLAVELIVADALLVRAMALPLSVNVYVVSTVEFA